MDELEKEVCNVCKRTKSIKCTRKASKQNIEQQAKRMKKKSDSNFPNLAIGDNVRITIPDVTGARLTSDLQ